MKRYLVLVVAVALLIPATALATPSSNASRDCTTLKAKMGATAFGKAYATFGSCVSAMTPLERMNATSAQELCATTLGKTHNGVMFEPLYGSGRNVFGKCVSDKSQASAQVVRQTRPNPARSCISVRTQPKNAFGKCVAKAAHAQTAAEDSAARLCLTEQTLSGFVTHWGTNANRSNAFGMCVSSTAKSIEHQS
ncbi:MAG TPA: hypothetical protein VFW85_00855 [Gaiellaceae bacterium]|nr:hypothetical protein [Gaiellaceae bacterium]